MAEFQLTLKNATDLQYMPWTKCTFWQQIETIIEKLLVILELALLQETSVLMEDLHKQWLVMKFVSQILLW